MTRLGDIVDQAFGNAFKSADFTEDATDIRLLRGDNIGQGRLRWDRVKRYPRSLAAEFGRYQLRRGDIVLAMDRPWIAAGLKFSVVRASDLPCLLVQRVSRLRARKGVDQRYLAAIIGSKTFADYVIGVQTGSAVPHISGGQIADFEVPSLPALAMQRAVGKLLGALEEKIESNRRQITCIEALGAASVESRLTFDSYGFPPYHSSLRLGDILTVLETGSRPRGGVKASDSGAVSLGAESVQSAGVCATSVFKRVPAGFVASMKRGRLQDGDVLVYKDGGKPGNFTPHVSAFGYGFPVSEASINEHVYRVRSGEGISQALLYWLLRSPWMEEEMRRRGTGVAIPGLNSTNFRELPLPVLGHDDVSGLNDQLSPMLVALLRLGTENLRLGRLRDTLLPELLSGRLTVAEAAEAVA